MIDGITKQSNANKWTSAYYVPKTTGFYLLRNTLKFLDQPFNTYLFVSNAHAPEPLYYSSNDNDPMALCLDNDLRMFYELDNVETGRSYKSKKLKWKDLRYACRCYWKKLNKVDTKYTVKLETANAIYNIFDGFSNPYNMNTIVYANRRNYDKFFS